MKYSLEEFIRDAQTDVLTAPDYVDFQYSDGKEAENRVFDLLMKTDDLSLFSEELKGKITDWVTEYHFSPIRHNLLRHLHIPSDAKILELGAGCGAITRLLGENGGSVTSVEGSLQRARCARRRCYDLENVEVYCSNFQDVNFEPKYDIVTLIGVLEYSPIFFGGVDPLVSCLSHARSALKPDGVLLIAIENQLGLKYFCGSSEDHVSKQYFGLEDLYSEKTVKTLGRNSLESTIQRAGFSGIEFQYPFPDYKLPQFVFMEAAFQYKEFLPSQIIRQLRSRDYSQRYQHSIEERFLWPVIDQNGLIPHLSNSFLIKASQRDTNSIDKNGEDVLAIGYTLNRAIEYNTKTLISVEDAITVKVEKTLMADYMKTKSAYISHEPGKESYVKGLHLESEILKTIRQGDFEKFIAYIKLWTDYVFENGVLDKNVEDVLACGIKPEFIDCIPENMILTPDGVDYIDREWRVTEHVTVGALLLRYLTNITQDREANKFINRNVTGSAHAICKIFNELGMKCNKTHFYEYALMHNKINMAVFPWKNKLTESDMNEQFYLNTGHDKDNHLSLKKVYWVCLEKLHAIRNRK